MTVPFYRRRGFLITAGVLAIPAIALAWWLTAPLFQDDVINEEFPRAATADIPDDMTIEEVEKEMEEAEEIMVEADDPMPEVVEATNETDDSDEPTGPVAVLTGEVIGADAFHQGTGTATIYRLEDGSHVLRLEDFEVTNGPDLHVILSPVASAEGRDDVMASGYVDLGSLKGNRGSQNYDIPADVDITSGEWTVVIYCVPFHVLFATAGLSA